jgi:hypothetical protein
MCLLRRHDKVGAVEDDRPIQEKTPAEIDEPLANTGKLRAHKPPKTARADDATHLGPKGYDAKKLWYGRPVEIAPDESDNKNPGNLNGKDFYIGTVSPLDGYIESTVTHEKAEKEGWHHKYYLPQEDYGKVNSDESLMFSLQPGQGGVVWAHHPQNHRPDLKKKVLDQITVDWGNKPKIGAVRDENVRCPKCSEKHDPSDACAPTQQQQLPLWDKKGAMQWWNGFANDEKCGWCQGMGAKKDCAECKGTGGIQGSHVTSKCGGCNGTGENPNPGHACQVCQGAGFATKVAGWEWIGEFKKQPSDYGLCGWCEGDGQEVRCANCDSVNTEPLDDEIECYDCGEISAKSLCRHCKGSGIQKDSAVEIDPAYKYPKGPYDCKNCDRKVWEEPSTTCSISGERPGSSHLHEVIPDDVMNDMRSIMQQGKEQSQSGPAYRDHSPLRMRVEGKDYEQCARCSGTGNSPFDGSGKPECKKCKGSGLVRSTTLTDPEHGTIELGKSAQGERVLAHLELRPPQHPGTSKTTEHKPVTEDMLDFSLTGTVLPRGWRPGWDSRGGGAMGGGFGKQIVKPAPGISRDLINHIDGLDKYHLNGMKSHCVHQGWDWDCSNCGAHNAPYPERKKSKTAAVEAEECPACKGTGKSDYATAGGTCATCKGSGLFEGGFSQIRNHMWEEHGEVDPGWLDDTNPDGDWLDQQNLAAAHDEAHANLLCGGCGMPRVVHDTWWNDNFGGNDPSHKFEKTALFDYDPVRDVNPSGKSAPAPSAQGQGGDPWPNQGDNGIEPVRPGFIFDKKLKKWVKDMQLTYPGVGPTFPGVTNINEVG